MDIFDLYSKRLQLVTCKDCIGMCILILCNVVLVCCNVMAFCVDCVYVFHGVV